MSNILGSNYTIIERKSSRFGAVGITDRGTELSTTPSIFTKSNYKVTQNYYNNLKRKDIYKTALDKYVHDQLARPIVNLIVYAIFSGEPDFQGNEGLVKIARQIVKDSQIDWSTWGVDLEVNGDVFVGSFAKGIRPKIASLPAMSMDIEYDEDNIIDIKAYIQNANLPDKKRLSPNMITHIKINNTSNMIFGSSTLRPCFWWLDVLDNLWERNWIRGSQYYGAPIIVITGVPSEHQSTVKTSTEGEGQRPGKNWIFSEGVKAEALDFTKNYPIELLIDRVYQYILSSCNIPQHLIYESDSSRGVAMFSGDAFEMMIKMRQKTWELGIVEAIRKVLRLQNNKLSEEELIIKWAPVFTRDLKNLAQLIQVGVENKLFSRKSAREALKLDHSEELENLKKQKVEEPDEVPPPVASTPKVKDNKQVPHTS